MRHWIVLASVAALSAPACVLHLGGDDGESMEWDDANPTIGPPTEQPCYVAATDGGNGGPGGLLSIRTTNPALIEGALVADGGLAGDAGASDLWAAAQPGTAGDVGKSELSEDPAYLFDMTSVQFEDWIAIGLGNSDDIISVGGSEANPTIAVGRIEIGEGATLAISRYPTIYASEVTIHEGARLILRDTGKVLVAVGPGSSAEEPGVHGGTVTLIAAQVTVLGTLDASGSDGAAGQDGGLGGHLRIRAENLTLGPNGAILVGGGNGGQGADERGCMVR